MTSTLGVDPMPSTVENLTHDRFLSGKIRVWQPKSGHRAGIDPVLLAAATQARGGQSVLELGCGVGVASLCLARRVGDLEVFGVELQREYAALAQRNAAENGIELAVVNADLADLPAEIRSKSFDHVIANPPYYRTGHGTRAVDDGRFTSLTEATPLSVWIDVAVRRMAPRGYLTLIQKADRLQDVLCAMDSRLGDVKVRPLAPRSGRPAELIILQARKGARGPFRLLAPLVLHRGDTHERDGETYVDQVNAVLRDGAALEIF